MKTSYHDVYVTTSKITRRQFSTLPFGYALTCNRSSGWTLSKDGEVVASEFGRGLRIEVGRKIIVDSFRAQAKGST